VPIASGGPLSLLLVAWDAQTSGNAADPQRLPLGIRAEAGAAPATLTGTSALLAADLPANEANHITLFAEHDAAVMLLPPPVSAGALQLGAASAGATFTQLPARRPTCMSRTPALL
jgi:hypothetical protein